MKKVWICLLALVMLFTGCGAEKEEAPMTGPYTLEIEYGDSGVEAEVGTYLWHTGGEILRQEKEIPFAGLSEVPFINLNKSETVKLLFDRTPDSLEVRCWSSEDGYQQSTAVEKPRTKLTAPNDGASRLYEVKAGWQQTDKASWGTATYYFRCLPQGAAGDQSEEMAFYHLIQLTPKDLFGAEVTNVLDAEMKLCRSQEDVTLILDYLHDHLSTNFHPVEVGENQADYKLRLAATDGTQYVFEYGGEGKNAWIRMEGSAYEAGVMDLYSLWTQLGAASESLDEDWKSEYLQVSEELPSGEWGTEMVYGYLQGLDAEVLYDEILVEEDETGSDAYKLKHGTLGMTKPLAEDCQFWILKDHFAPFCQVTREQLWQWSEEADYDVLFSMYVKDDQVVAICEQFEP